MTHAQRSEQSLTLQNNLLLTKHILGRCMNAIGVNFLQNIVGFTDGA